MLNIRAVANIIRSTDDFRAAQFDVQRREGKVREGLLFFNGIWGLFSICDLLLRPHADSAVVLITERLDLPGVPVSRVVEFVASYVHNAFLKFVPAEEITWIEARRPRYIPLVGCRENFSRLSLEYHYIERTHVYTCPSRMAISREAAQALVEV